MTRKKLQENRIIKHIQENYHEQIIEAEDKNHTSLLEIPYSEIKEYTPLNQIDTCITIIEDTANEFTDEENHIYIQVTDVPHTCKLSQLDAENIGKFISASAMIKSITKIQPEMVRGTFICKSCGYTIKITNEDTDTIISPDKCPNCNKNLVTIVQKQSKFQNLQLMQLEEPLELRETGTSAPSRFKAMITGYLAGAKYHLKAGDVVNITGTLESEQTKTQGKYDFMINLNTIKPQKNMFQSENLTHEDIRNIHELSKDKNIFERLTLSIAPKVFGNKMIKEGLVLQQFEAEQTDSGVVVGDRGTIHILIIGDPSLGKTKLLDCVCETTPKFVRTGNVTSDVGLTAAVTKDELTGDFSVNAGAIILADGGIVVMDEFGQLQSETQEGLNEPMESCTVTVSKASITQTLSARTSFLCAANPKNSRFDPYDNIEKQINIPPSTLSRFDLIYAMTDEVNEDRDYKLMKAILEDDICVDETELEIISSDLFMKYVTYAKKYIHPKLSNEAIEYISTFYKETRKEANEQEDTVTITTRNGKGIARLAVARAKAELREEVTVSDVEEAIRIFSDSLATTGLDLLTAGKIAGDTSKKELSLIKECERQIEDMFLEYGNYKFNKDDIEEMKENVIIECEADRNSVDRAYTKAIKNIVKK